MFLGLVSYEKTPKMQCGERALCCTGKTQGPYLATARSQQEGSHWHQEGRGQPLDCEKFCQVAFFIFITHRVCLLNSPWQEKC